MPGFVTYPAISSNAGECSFVIIKMGEKRYRWRVSRQCKEIVDTDSPRGDED